MVIDLHLPDAHGVSGIEFLRRAAPELPIVAMTGNTAAWGSPVHFDNPLALRRADPHISRHTDGSYYFTATVPTYDSVVLRRSTTLQGLGTAEEHVVWRRRDSGEMSKHIWAPELHHVGGRWYVYFAAGSAEDIASMIGTSRETVSRVLSEFQRRGFVELHQSGVAGHVGEHDRRESTADLARDRLGHRGRRHGGLDLLVCTMRMERPFRDPFVPRSAPPSSLASCGPYLQVRSASALESTTQFDTYR